MAAPRFVWIIRSWCSEDSFWEHVREHKEYDIAYRKPELLLEEVQRIILKEQKDWEDLCLDSGISKESRLIEIDIPTLDQLKSRPFYKFLTISSATDDYMQSWYIERMKVTDA
jgi:hypothetical protein